MEDEKDAGKLVSQSPLRDSQRKITVSLLATSVVLTLSSWDAMAHANRSSHKSAEGFNWSPDRYILMRQSLEDPMNPDTQALKKLYERFDALNRPGAAPADPLERQTVRDGIKTLEDKLRLTPQSAKVFAFAKQRDAAAVAALLESTGDSEAVLDAYNWSILDISRRSDQGLLTTDRDLDAVVTVGQSARDYVQRVQTELAANKDYPNRKILQSKAAMLLHNVGSMSIPDIGKPTPAALALGLDAAHAEVKLRTELGEPFDTARAKLLVGRHLVKKGDIAGAKTVLRKVKVDADRTGHHSLQAFSRVYLAEVAQADKNPALATRLRKQSLDLLARPAAAIWSNATATVHRDTAAPVDGPAGTVRDKQEREQSINDVAYLRAYLALKP